jgi:hypothetical protein
MPRSCRVSNITIRITHAGMEMMHFKKQAFMIAFE